MWIEDLPLDQLKLFFTHYRTTYKEFIILSEMTTTILQDMGIFLKTFTRKRSDRKPAHFMDFEEEGELEMSDQGVYEENGDQVDELHMNDVSLLEDGTPRNQDG